MKNNKYESYSHYNIKSGSQPYKDLYNVVSDMLARDKQYNDIYDSEAGYFTNPSAKILQEELKNGTLLKDETTGNFSRIYVMDKGGNIIFGKRVNPNNAKQRSPHPALIGGMNPEVICAGMLKFVDKKIHSINNHSGHYKPDIQSLEHMDKKLQELCNEYPQYFHEASKWFKQANTSQKKQHPDT